MARRAAGLADTLNRLFRQYGLATKVEHCSSFLYFSLHAEHPLAPLLFYHLRDRGIHVQDGFPLFLTTAHTDDGYRRDCGSLSRQPRRDGARRHFRSKPTAARARDGAGGRVGRIARRPKARPRFGCRRRWGTTASCAFNESVTLRLTGPLDQDALAAALTRVVARHDALRLRFSATGEEMSAAAANAFPCSTIDSTAIAVPARPRKLLAAHIAQDARTPFDLVEGPPDPRTLVQAVARVARPGADRASHRLRRLVDERRHLRARRDLCARCARARPPDLPPVLPFSDYARAQARRDPAEREAVEAYWLEQFKAPPIRRSTCRPTGRVRR